MKSKILILLFCFLSYNTYSSDVDNQDFANLRELLNDFYEHYNLREYDDLSSLFHYPNDYSENERNYRQRMVKHELRIIREELGLLSALQDSVGNGSMHVWGITGEKMNGDLDMSKSFMLETAFLKENNPKLLFTYLFDGTGYKIRFLTFGFTSDKKGIVDRLNSKAHSEDEMIKSKFQYKEVQGDGDKE